jgi:hypothetical protein
MAAKMGRGLSVIEIICFFDTTLHKASPAGWVSVQHFEISADVRRAI